MRHDVLCYRYKDYPDKPKEEESSKNEESKPKEEESSKNEESSKDSKKHE